MRTERIGIYLAVIGLVGAMAGMAGCSGEMQTSEQLAVPREEAADGSGQEAGSSGEEGRNTFAGKEGIDRQVQAPERYEAELSQGAISVRADAKVVLPSGAGFLNYKVKGRPFSQEDLDTVIRVLLKDAPLWERDWEAMGDSHGFTQSEIQKRIERLKSSAAGNGGAIVKNDKNKTYEEEISEWEELLSHAPEEPIIRDVEAVVPYVKKTEAGEETMEANSLSAYATVDGEDYWLSVDNNYQEDWLWDEISLRSGERSLGDNYTDLGGEAPPEGLSPDRIRENAVSLMREMGFTDFEPAGGEYFQALSGDEETDEIVLGDIGYGIHFTRVLDGIPVTYTHEPGTTIEGDEAPWPYEKIDMVFDEEGLTDFVWRNPYEIDRQSDEYVFLMPFSDIRDIFEEMIFQKYRWIAENGDISVSFDIDEVRLGYMRVRNDTKTDEGSMIPVWDFLGTQTLIYADEIEALIADGVLAYKDGELVSVSGEGDTGEENLPNVVSCSYESWLTIDATTGRLIDRGISR